MRFAEHGRVRVRLVAGLAMCAGLAGMPAAAQNAGAPTGVTPRASAESPAGDAVMGRGASSLPPLPPVPSRTEEGTLNGSDFRVDLPVGSGTQAGAGVLPGWNRKLVVYFHGYQSDPQRFRMNPATHGPNAPSRQIQQLLRRGYAVVQPGYRTGGWAIATAPADAEALRKYLRSTTGRHGRRLWWGSRWAGC